MRMMKLKGSCFILLGVLFAAILICSTTAAVAEKSDKDVVVVDDHDEVKEPDQYGGRCRYGCCGWRGGPYGCTRCCRANEEVKEMNGDEAEGVKEPEQIGRVRRCRFGCCLSGRFGCLRCCRAADEEAKEAATDAKEPEQYGRTPPRCRYGCCFRGRYGCARCCRTEQESKAANGAAAAVDGNN